MAGILEHIVEITAFLNTVPESYKRLGVFKAPRYISWGPENRSHIIRVPAATGEYTRLELRSPDCMANPYIASALIMEAGIDGVKRNLTPPAALEINMFKAPQDVLSKLKKLPESYEEAMSLAEKSEFVKALLPASMIEAYKNR
jgi:glutamine synthetase